jgi:hypothetical protein
LGGNGSLEIVTTLFVDIIILSPHLFDATSQAHDPIIRGFRLPQAKNRACSV